MVSILQTGNIENLGKETRPLDKTTLKGVCLAQSEGQLAVVSNSNGTKWNGNQWKNPRTRVRNLKARGVRHKWAVMVGNTRKGEWRLSKNSSVCLALPDTYFTRSLGLVLLGQTCQ